MKLNKILTLKKKKKSNDPTGVLLVKFFFLFKLQSQFRFSFTLYFKTWTIYLEIILSCFVDFLYYYYYYFFSRYLIFYIWPILPNRKPLVPLLRMCNNPLFWSFLDISSVTILLSSILVCNSIEFYQMKRNKVEVTGGEEINK